MLASSSFSCNFPGVKRDEEETSQLFVAIALGVYAVLVVFISFHPELWRDEVRALSVVRASQGLFDLFRNLQNEGHPALWYLVLGAVYQLEQRPSALMCASLGVAVIAAYLFLTYSPFSKWQKILFLFGLYPLYEYSVKCRGYGLGMAFLFSYCAIYPERFRKPITVCFILALLANTSAVAWLISVALASAFVFEAIVIAKLSRPKLVRFIGGQLLFAVGAGLAAWQMKPSTDSLVTNPVVLSVGSVLTVLKDALLSHGALFHNALYSPFGLIVPLLILSLYLLLIRTPSLVVALFASILAFEMTHRLFFPLTALRHQGFLFLVIIVTLWLDRIKEPEILASSTRFRALEGKRRKALDYGLSILLLLQVYSGLKATTLEVRSPFSSAKALGSFIDSHAVLKDAIIMAEPDYLVETLPYYVRNRIYLPREDAFKEFVSFTKNTRISISLRELLESARKVGKRMNASVLMLLPSDVEQGKTYELLYGRTFVVGDGLPILLREAEKLRVFNEAFGDENFSVWLLH